MFRCRCGRILLASACYESLDSRCKHFSCVTEVALVVLRNLSVTLWQVLIVYAEAKRIRPQQQRNIIFCTSLRVVTGVRVLILTSRFYSMPKLENFLNHNCNWNRLTLLNKDLQFKEGLDEILCENSRIISDCRVCMYYFKNTSGYLDTIYGANSDRKLTTDRMAILPSDAPLSQ